MDVRHWLPAPRQEVFKNIFAPPAPIPNLQPHLQEQIGSDTDEELDLIVNRGNRYDHRLPNQFGRAQT